MLIVLLLFSGCSTPDVENTEKAIKDGNKSNIEEGLLNDSLEGNTLIEVDSGN